MTQRGTWMSPLSFEYSLRWDIYLSSFLPVLTFRGLMVREREH